MPATLSFCIMNSFFATYVTISLSHLCLSLPLPVAGPLSPSLSPSLFFLSFSLSLYDFSLFSIFVSQSHSPFSSVTPQPFSIFLSSLFIFVSLFLFSLSFYSYLIARLSFCLTNSFFDTSVIIYLFHHCLSLPLSVAGPLSPSLCLSLSLSLSLLFFSPSLSLYAFSLFSYITPSLSLISCPCILFLYLPLSLCLSLYLTVSLSLFIASFIICPSHLTLMLPFPAANFLFLS